MPIALRLAAFAAGLAVLFPWLVGKIPITVTRTSLTRWIRIDLPTMPGSPPNWRCQKLWPRTTIKDPGAYVVPGYPNGVMPTFASLGEQKIADLVAFLTQKS